MIKLYLFWGLVAVYIHNSGGFRVISDWLSVGSLLRMSFIGINLFGKEFGLSIDWHVRGCVDYSFTINSTEYTCRIYDSRGIRRYIEFY